MPPAVAATPMLTAPPPALGADHVAFKLYKILAEVGAERDTVVARPDGGTEAKAVFSYRDRKTTVPVAASYAFGPDGSLKSYAAWGRTSRFTEIDDRVVARPDGAFDVTREGAGTRRVKPDGLAVAVSGFAPMLGQDLLLRAWDQHGRPAKLATLPEGEVAIESRGKESYARDAGPVTLEHVAVTGLVWGREDAWLDDQGQLAAVVTRDAEFDHNAAVREGYDTLLPALARSAGADGVAWLAAMARGPSGAPPAAWRWSAGRSSTEPAGRR